jgi:predicted ferric reductase
MSLRLRGLFWLTIYLLLVLGPLFVLLIGPVPEGRNFWLEFSVALGFAGLAMMGFQFALTARFKRALAPFGIDIIYHFHRQISLIAFVLILTHPIIIFILDPESLRLLNIFEAGWQARTGVLSVVALIALVITSLWRMRLKINYEAWRASHGILASLAVALGMAHTAIVANYVETPWKRVIWLALPIFWIGLLVWVRVVTPLRMLRRPYRVADVIEERGGTWTLVLQPDGHSGLRFKPGQFAWLTLWNSPYAIKEHPFSFSSSAANPQQLRMTIKELGDFTATIKEAQAGKRAYLDGPYGQFSIDRYPAQGYVFISGGSGIGPIMSMLRTLADREDKRPLLLIYANKEWDGVIFREEIEALQQRLNLQVVHVLEEAPEGWEGETGFITADVLKRYLPEHRASREYFVCGPDPMMDAVEGALTEIGVPLNNIQSERYNFV